MNQINPDTTPQSLCSNPACGAANRAGTRFCASCGTALSAAQAATPAQPAYIPPPQPPRFNSSSGLQPLATDKAADVQMAPEWAFHHVVQALQAMQGQIDSQTPPHGLTATLNKKSIGNPICFRCQVSVKPTGPTSSRIVYGIKVDWNSTFLMLGILVAAGAFNILFLTMSIGPLAPLLSVVAIGWAAYDYAIGMPNRLAADLQKRLLTPATPAALPPVQQPAPQAAPSNVTPLPTAAAPSFTPQVFTPAPDPVPAQPSDSDDIVARIEKLAALKDKGLISEAEFDKRRAELLDRL